MDSKLVATAALAAAAGAGLFYVLTTTKKQILKDLKFYYFPVASRGDGHRLALTIAGIPFENVRIMPANWMTTKPTTLWGSLPYAELADGTVIGQSRTILRMIGKGTGLYPEDALAAAQVDECLDGCDDMANTTNKTGQGLAGPEKLEARVAAQKEGGDIYTAVKRLEACYARAGTPGPYLTGKLTIADLQVFAQLGWAVSGFFDGVNAEFLEAFPKLKAVRKAVVMLPQVASYYEGEKGQPYMEASAGGHPIKECYASMLASAGA